MSMNDDVNESSLTLGEGVHDSMYMINDSNV